MGWGWRAEAGEWVTFLRKMVIDHSEFGIWKTEWPLWIRKKTCFHVSLLGKKKKKRWSESLSLRRRHLSRDLKKVWTWLHWYLGSYISGSGPRKGPGTDGVWGVRTVAGRPGCLEQSQGHSWQKSDARWSVASASWELIRNHNSNLWLPGGRKGGRDS